MMEQSQKDLLVPDNIRGKSQISGTEYKSDLGIPVVTDNLSPPGRGGNVSNSFLLKHKQKDRGQRSSLLLGHSSNFIFVLYFEVSFLCY